MSDEAESELLARRTLFPSDVEIARRLGLSARRWRAVSRALEPQGLPRRDPLVGARYWPAVVAYFHARYGLGGAMYPGPPDGEEHWHAR